MKLEEIKSKLERKAAKFLTGGFRPTGQMDESWIGRVIAYLPDENLPTDKEGFPMIPLAQFGITNMPWVPEILVGIKLLSVFISSKTLPAPFEGMGSHFLIREYQTLDGLVSKDLKHPESKIKALPLQGLLVEADYPVWDDGEMSWELMKAILRLEEEGEIDTYYDFASNASEHKFGGYPSYCQSGRPFKDGYEFVFQVSSDPKANLNIVHGGSLMFAKNVESGNWQVYYDFM